MTQRFLPVAAALFAALSFLACSPPEATEPAAPAEHTPESNEALFTLPDLDHGHAQSPVNMLTGETEVQSHEIVFATKHSRAEDIVNTGHSVQVDFEPGSTVTFDQKQYNLAQCHSHTPSEHQVDGVTYPMELHCVSLLPQAPGSDAPPQYLVVGFLFKMGEENPFIAEFLNLVPESPEKVDMASNKIPIFIEDLTSQLSGREHYYHYRGSLTTPPYTETVTWLVVQRILAASAEQIQRINRLEGNNARHVQALYGRAVGAN